jgi:DNA-directed RNA polymerase specialized sigma24 family protein
MRVGRDSLEGYPPFPLSREATHVTFDALQQNNSKHLAQLYRFCLLMTGDPVRAREIFLATMHEIALRAAQGELPSDRFWMFRDARGRCLEASETGLQAEEIELEEHPIAPGAAAQIKKLEPLQLAIWVAGAPEPQRTALALFYLDHFDHTDILELTDLKTAELGKLMANARQQFQAWLNATVPDDQT